MPNLDLSILIVDDTKFSSTLIAKTLSNAGYRDLRIANDAKSALAMLEKRRCSVLVADWLMPEMDGLEMTRQVRLLDEQSNHFTYVILLTAKESPEALTEAFDKGVDDFIFKSDMSKQLLPRVYAADRMADQQNTLLSANQLLLENNQHLEQYNLVDIETGIGNQRYARDALERQIRHAESRGGACSYMMINIKNWKEIKTRNKQQILEEVSVGISRRLRSLTRPLDTVCRIKEDTYGIVANFDDIEHCTLSSYRRIHDSINHQAFRTSAGYISVSVASSVCTVAGNTTPIPTIEQVETGCMESLRHAIETDTVSINRWKA